METYGPEAVELLRRAGKPSDQWQADALDLMLAIRPDGRWACFEYVELVARQNGKGGILEGRALAGLLLLGEELLMWSAHEYKTAMEAFRRVLGLLRVLGERVSDTLIDVFGILVKISNTNGEEGFERLDTGQRLKFIARSKSSGRGFSGDVNFIDEAFAYTPEQHEALMFTMSARPNPQIIYTSSPPLDGLTGKILFALRKRALAGGDDALGYRDWGLDGDLDHLDQIDMDDRTLWAATNPALGIRISLETIERERRSMTDNGGAGFARERLGVWPVRIDARGAQWAHIAEELWRDLADPGTERPDDVAFAIAVNMARTYGAIVAVGPRPDGQMVLSVVDYRAGTAWIPDRAAKLKERWNPVAIGMDVKGPAGSLLLDLERHGITAPDDPDQPQRGDLAVPTAQDAAAAFGLFVDLARNRGMVHLDEAPLNVAVAGATTRSLAGGTAWERKGPVDISTLDGATTAHWAYVTRVDVVSDYDVADSFG